MGMADGATNSKLGSSALSSSRSAARPNAHSWRKMYEPLAWTAFTTCGMGSDSGLLVGMSKTHLLPSPDLRIGVNVRSMVVRPGGRVDGAGLGYQQRSRNRRTLGIILHTQFGVDVILGSSNTGERCENDVVREGHWTDLKRCEESRRLGGRRRHVSGVEY